MAREPGSGVLLIYTGGTIGSVRRDPDNPDSPLQPAVAEELLDHVQEVRNGAIRLENRLIPVELVALDEVVDSSQIEPRHWKAIGQLIEQHYSSFEGFVILHGTDTLAYTASALAFMIDHLDKPVILTGSQRPIGENRSDAAQNLITAIEIAAARSLGGVVVPEVCIYFSNLLLRGCRATKYDADAYTGFASPNYPPLGNAGSRIEIYPELIRPVDPHALVVRTDFDDGVAVLEIGPLMNLDVFEQVLDSEGLRGVILKTYGAGNTPGGRFLDIVRRAVRRGVRIVVVTQCYAGTVRLGSYNASTGLLEAGVISGLDMTPEAAQAKLALLLADPSQIYPPETLMQVDLRGEMDESLFDLHFGGGEADGEATVWSQGPIPASRFFRQDKVFRAKLRIIGLRVPEAEKSRISLAFYLNPGSSREEEPPAAQVRDVLWDRSLEDRISVYVDITDAVVRQLEDDKRNRLTVVCTSGERIEWQSLHIAVFTEP